MDTKLKKFNVSALLKVIAVLLCLLCVFGTATQLASSVVMLEERNLNENNFLDALYTKDKDAPVWETNSFKNEYQRYGNYLSYIIATFGDGSESAYNKMVDLKTKQNNEAITRAKENLIALVEQKDGFFDYLVALSSGDIVNCGYVQASDKLDSDNFFYEDEIYDSYVDYGWISSTSFSVYNMNYEVALTDDARKKADEAKADGVVYLSSAAFVLDSYDGEAITSYPAGYYFFRVDENTLAFNLAENGICDYSYSSYNDFKEDYEAQMQYLSENYSSGRYYVRDVEGNTYTNIKSLGKKSTEDEIISAFEKTGFYTYEDENRGMVLSDGRYYTDFSFVSQLESEVFDEGSVYYYDDEVTVVTTVIPTVVSTTTTMPSTTAVAETTAVPEPTVAAQDNFATSVAVTVPETTFGGYNGKSPFILLTEKVSDMDVFVGVDMNSEAYSDMECRFSQTKNKIILARDLAKDTIKTCGILGLLFVALFIFLVLKSARRFGNSETVYMFRLDSMFTDWRIAIDCAIGFGIALVIIGVLDEFWPFDEITDIAVYSVGALCAAFSAVVLDLVLFVARHIKNKTLFKRLFVVWIAEKIFKKASQKIKKAKDSNRLAQLKNKFQYVKGFEKETVIKGAIVLGLNLVLGFLAAVEFANTETLWFAFVLLGFDVFVCVQLVRFIAGVKKIFSAVNEIKQGNYEVQINLYAIPSSLREPATKLMSLRDGLKTAVEEAVKQEQTKTELITNVSHDLKTPLTSIINYVELLKKCSIEDGEAKEYLDVLGEKSDRLKKLIEDLVEASKASTGNIKVEFVEVSLNEITSQIIGEYSDAFDQKGLSLITSFPEENIIAKADSKMLYRVLENLMGNVSKYAMENTRVYLSVDKRDGRGVISVKNISGSPLNITAEQLKARFVRGDQARTTEGSGLGLSIAESLCEIQGGKLNIMINGDLFVAEVII